jgi:hypothetical protein
MGGEEKSSVMTHEYLGQEPREYTMGEAFSISLAASAAGTIFVAIVLFPLREWWKRRKRRKQQHGSLH